MEENEKNSAGCKKPADNNNYQEISAALSAQKEAIETNIRLSREILWANVFHDTVRGSSWLKDQTFSLGRWAIGYPFAYVLYRVLDEARPGSILELGLGQSTRFTAQYAAANPGTEHVVIEHDEEWISFFSENYPVPKSTKICLCPWDFENFMGAKNVRVFKDFHKVTAGRRFNLILIDAPLGGDMKDYARIDVLKEMPGCLAESFIILIDDYNRAAERRTGSQMLKNLKENNIPFFTGSYIGEKETYVICSADNKFVRTM